MLWMCSKWLNFWIKKNYILGLDKKWQLSYIKFEKKNNINNTKKEKTQNKRKKKTWMGSY